MAAITVASSIMVIKAKEIVHCALFCIAALMGTAGVYILLNAQFIGVIQILVYVGAIGVVILFAVMLTKRKVGTDE
ncbi:MAG TPA: NADH-quinone oxidoreductase subunit J [Candidatus Methanoperedenaceae archaeon]|nr:NADH-quinone oxidoreductase subunit J [Candidatus Methanoperedenaceae archaeon]